MIIFNYKISDFINSTEILSVYRANSLVDQSNAPEPNDSAISKDDEALIKKYLSIGASTIAQALSGYNKDLLDSLGNTLVMVGEPYEFNVVFEEVVGSIVYRINVPENFNLSVLEAFDNAIKDCLENYVLYRVCKNKAIEFKSYQEDYENALGQIRMYVNRRNGTIKRRYNLI